MHSLKSQSEDLDYWIPDPDKGYEFDTDIFADLTKQQEDNYIRLCHGIRLADPDHFSMTCFWQDYNGLDHSADKENVERGPEACGTVACATGWAPALGVEVPTGAVKGAIVDWDEFLYTQFGAARIGARSNDKQVKRRYNWIFHHAWATAEGSIKGVAARIHIMLNYGLPTKFIHDMGRFLASHHFISLASHYFSSPYRLSRPDGSDVSWKHIRLPGITLKDLKEGRFPDHKEINDGI